MCYSFASFSDINVGFLVKVFVLIVGMLIMVVEQGEISS